MIHMPSSTRRAFTLVEILVVLMILGIASAVVVPQMLSAGQLGVQAAVRVVVADLLFAQNDAVTHQQPRQVMFDVAQNRYRLADAQGATLSVAWKSGQSENYVVDFSQDSRFNGVRLVSCDFGGQTTLAFDEMGGPSSGGNLVLAYNEQRFRVKVAAFTGRVTVEPMP